MFFKKAYFYTHASCKKIHVCNSGTFQTIKKIESRPAVVLVHKV